MQIYLIRHGATRGNMEHRYVGSTDEPLTEEAVQELQDDKGKYPQPALVFVSPLKRCTRTAELLFPDREKEVLQNLRECEFGAFEYKNYEELREDKRYQAWIDSDGKLPFPGGESREAFSHRCCDSFLEGCCRMMEGGYDSAAFVVHGGTIMAILDRFSSPHRDYFDWQVKNGRGFSCTLEISESGFQLTEISELPFFTGIEDQFVMKQDKKLRCGYTTGSCAAAAAKGAAEMLLGGRICRSVDLMTPKGILLHLPLEEQKIQREHPEGKAVFASCAVRKFAGDDPDATDGILICASASPVQEETESQEDRIIIDGGIGVGRVTKPGLEQPVGAAAINRVPREMIAREVESVCETYEYPGKIRITVSVPEGIEIGKKTFNPHIGIEGGISILGTSGIVVPMSEEALIASIRVEMKQKIAAGEQYLLITPGNYGADFIRRKELSPALDADHSMKCSNYVGETVDMAAELGAKGILFVAHIGKFIKVSGGIMNTHSASADCRAELIASQTMRAGKKQYEIPPAVVNDTVCRLLDTNTTEEAVGILKETGLLESAIREITERIQYYLQKRCKNKIQTEVILFSNQYGYLGETQDADEMMRKIIVQNNHYME
ncbi:MAG: cobalt-precorrin-5B (C(1))-methyltransferase CbiD [Candidatus Choladocola sp.]|nr:cobalt-precorrin-5B (C(1))-methyltransferase CbiD [Candidatus Choladocola sp.]